MLEVVVLNVVAPSQVQKIAKLLFFAKSAKNCNLMKRWKSWRHDIQHNDTQHNDIQHNDFQHNDIQHNDIKHNDPQHKGLICDPQHK
jgi:hypothetical protein